MVGGGQLSRMTAAPASALALGFRVLATSREESAAQVVADVVIGHHDDLDALRDLAAGCDVVTFDHEHVPPAYLRELEGMGVAVRPGPSALVHAQDKRTMREALTSMGAPTPGWSVVEGVDDLPRVGDLLGWPLVLKVSRGGYDGRGVWVVSSAEEAAGVMRSTDLVPDAVWLAEEFVPFTRELAAQVARSPSGQAIAYPVVRTVQVDGMCSEVVAPCPDLSDDRAMEAQELALRIARDLDVTGMLAVELFDSPRGIVVNELAMRPHNSGHWSIDGARAVLDLPLGDPRPRARWTVMANVLGGDYPDMYAAYLHCMARDPQLKIHMYGKDVKPGRKVGHVNAYGEDLEDVLRARPSRRRVVPR